MTELGGSSSATPYETTFAANLAASVLTAAKKDWKHLPLLPVVYAILHLSCGLGFLVGLFRFWNRWHDRKGRVPELDWQSTGSE
jgi:hypothetical protein